MGKGQTDRTEASVCRAPDRALSLIDFTELQMHPAAPQKRVGQHRILDQEFVEHDRARLCVAGGTEQSSEPEIRRKVVGIELQGSRIRSSRFTETTLDKKIL